MLDSAVAVPPPETSIGDPLAPGTAPVAALAAEMVASGPLVPPSVPDASPLAPKEAVPAPLAETLPAEVDDPETLVPPLPSVEVDAVVLFDD